MGFCTDGRRASSRGKTDATAAEWDTGCTSQ
jgi:hypothetical protein